MDDVNGVSREELPALQQGILQLSSITGEHSIDLEPAPEGRPRAPMCRCSLVPLTEEHAKEWLERQADYYMANGQFTSDVPPGVSQLGVYAPAGSGVLDLSDLSAPLHERAALPSLGFFCTWDGKELATTRKPEGRASEGR
jgi:hypothetical protein